MIGDTRPSVTPIPFCDAIAWRAARSNGARCRYYQVVSMSTSPMTRAANQCFGVYIFEPRRNDYNRINYIGTLDSYLHTSSTGRDLNLFVTYIYLLKHSTRNKHLSIDQHVTSCDVILTSVSVVYCLFIMRCSNVM